MNPFLFHAVPGLLILTAEGSAEEGAHLVPQIVTVIIGFLIVFWVLKWFAFRPLLAVIDERRNQIAADLKRASDLQKQAEAERAEYEGHLRRIEEEARQKMQEMIDEGKRIAVVIQENARKQAEAIAEKAQQNIQYEMEKARVTLKGEIVDLTILAAEHLLKERLDDAKQRDLIGSFLSQIERN